MTNPFVLITSHRIEPHRMDEIRKVAAEYSDFVNTREAGMLAYYSYVSEAGDALTLVHVLVDAAAADRHMEAATELIGKGVALTEGNVRIDVLGAPGPVLTKALESNRANGVQVSVADRGLGGFARAVST